MKKYEEHKRRHAKLHHHLLELVSDWVEQAGAEPSCDTVEELVLWAQEQAADPTDNEGHIDMATCEGCGEEIDPVLCYCGNSIASHDNFIGHFPVPSGCDCYRETGRRRDANSYHEDGS